MAKKSVITDNIFSELQPLIETITSSDIVDNDYKAELPGQYRNIINESINSFSTFQEIPAGECKIIIEQYYSNTNGMVQEYKYQITKNVGGKQLPRLRYESPDKTYDDCEHFHEHHPLTGEKLNKLPHPRPTYNDIFEKAKDIYSESS